jgi:hypothetical protein
MMSSYIIDNIKIVNLIRVETSLSVREYFRFHLKLWKNTFSKQTICILSDGIKKRT